MGVSGVPEPSTTASALLLGLLLRHLGLFSVSSGLLRFSGPGRVSSSWEVDEHALGPSLAASAAGQASAALLGEIPQRDHTGFTPVAGGSC